MGMQIDAATMKNSMEVPQKIRTGLPYNPAIPLLGVYPKELKSESQRDISTCCSTIHSSQDIEITQVFISESMNEENVIYIYNGTLLSPKKK